MPNIEFLINEIYSPLFEEINLIKTNISELKNCYTQRYGRPDYSAPLPRDKVPGYIRKHMILTGKYKIIPKNLRMRLDEFYNECDNYNKILLKYNHKSSVEYKRRSIIEKQKSLLNCSEKLVEELQNKILGLK